jgi:hypothetical protein
MRSFPIGDTGGEKYARMQEQNEHASSGDRRALNEAPLVSHWSAKASHSTDVRLDILNLMPDKW